MEAVSAVHCLQKDSHGVTDRFMIEMVQYQHFYVSSLLSWPWGGILLLPIRRSVFGSLGGLLKRKLAVVSLKDSLSSKDNPIETRTKIIVGAMPWSGNVISKNKSVKTKEVEMNRYYYIHIKHLVDTSDY